MPKDQQLEEELDEYAQQAHKLVDHVIESAIKKLEFQLEEREKTLGEIQLDLSRQSTFEWQAPKREDYSVQNIEWLTIGQFTPELAEAKINEFIKTWDYQDSWLYCITYLGVEEFQFDNRHRYRVRWSIPTRRTPIPRATASVYFTFVVSKIKPKTFPVGVHYVFETNRLVHQPGKSRFREKWLKDIIENKVIMMEKIDF